MSEAILVLLSCGAGQVLGFIGIYVYREWAFKKKMAQREQAFRQKMARKLAEFEAQEHLKDMECIAEMDRMVRNHWPDRVTKKT